MSSGLHDFGKWCKYIFFLTKNKFFCGFLRVPEGIFPFIPESKNEVWSHPRE